MIPRGQVKTSMLNLVFKAGLVAPVGNYRLSKQVAALFGISLLTGCTVLIFW